MALVRRSTSSVTPLAARLVGGQRSFSHHCGGALFTAVNRTTKFNSGNLCLVPSFSRYCYSVLSALKRSSSDASLKRPNSDASLIKIIDSEINCSEQIYEEGEDIPEAFPFKIIQNPRYSTVSLRRKHQGEIISVVVEQYNIVRSQKNNDEDDNSDDDTEKDNQSKIPMDVKVFKSGGSCLKFDITAYADKIVINSLSIEENNDLASDQFPYEEPKFDDLDENLQKAFYKYLEMRGVKPSATNFLHQYVLKKEQGGHTNWLKNLKKFVEE
ncbi:uncharacterized protein At2g39795, mitochondrial-like [Rutidosis leptorrhynchoides]|uniref:uncharacterized protein At2g39795, mitochondrial-like n=1 Tax=Rutidosis leptorrhynchoides TaxID=125765 RepID=UPI003A991510